jgi:YegS/Rv2252/BmrU family lipid kinase
VADRAAPEPGVGAVGAVVVNPTKVDDPEALRQKLSAALQDAGWPQLHWLETTAEDPGYGMAEQARDAGAGLVLACGGDGTARAVITALAGTPIRLGVVPLGTGNLLARNLGLPFTDPDAAIEVAVRGRERLLDVGRVEPLRPGERVERFAVMAGIGMDAAIMRDAPEGAKSRLGWPAYLVSTLRHLRRPGVRMRLEIDGAAPRRVYAKTVLIGNVGTLQAGLALIPQARPDDGLLDVVVLSGRSLPDWLVTAGWVLRHRPHGDRHYASYQGKQIRIRTAGPQPRQVDGDLLAAGPCLAVEIEPAALRIHVPAEDG